MLHVSEKSIHTANLIFYADFLIFSYMVDALGNYGAYWMFAAFGIVGIAVTAKYLPETRNKSQREIQEYFAS